MAAQKSVSTLRNSPDRRRGGRPPRISREDIVEAVLPLLSEAWTIRSIAADLEVSEAAIYYYFPAKADLLVAVGRRLASQIAPPRLAGGWAGWLRAVGVWFYEFFASHPLLLDAHVDLYQGNVEQVWAVEDVLSDLMTAGFELDVASNALGTVIVLATGYAAMAVSLSGARGEELRGRVGEHAVRLPDTLTSRAYAAEGFWDARTRFDASLDLVIAGLQSMRAS